MQQPAPVFLRPLQEENGWSNATVSGATGMFFVVGGLAGFAIGPGVDRNGPIRYVRAGVVLMAISVAGLAFVSKPWHLYVTYAGQAVAFGLAGAVAVNAMMSRWFVTRRAFAMSLTFTRISLGGMILAPVGTWLVERGGTELAAPILAAIVLIGALPVALFVLVGDPASVGLEADAGAPDEGVRNDGMDKRVLTVMIIATQGLAVLGATLIDNRVLTYVFVLVVGFTIGNVYMMQTLLTAEIFGLVSLGAVLGFMTLVPVRSDDD